MIRRSVGNGGPQARSTAAARLPTPVGRGPRLRLAYDELLANQLALALIRDHARRQTGRGLCGDGSLRAKALAGFGFN